MPNGFPYLVANSGTLNPRFLETDAWSKVDFSVGWVSDKWSVVMYKENILDNDDYTLIMQP